MERYRSIGQSLQRAVAQMEEEEVGTGWISWKANELIFMVK